MPIRKLRQLPDDDDSLWMSPDDPNLWRTIRTVWELARRLCPPRFPPGVYKHRSIEDANRLTEEWEREQVHRQSAKKTK